MPTLHAAGLLSQPPARWSLVLAWSLMLVFRSLAAPPTFEHLQPVAVPRGSTNTIAAIGKFDPWPSKVWVDAPGITFTASTNTGSFTVEISTNAAVGPHFVRLFNDQGSGSPRFLIVTDSPQLSEQEPNDDFTKAQAIDALPAWINGRLDKSGDVDNYAVTLAAGQTLVASVQSYVLMSPVDAALRLLDARGFEAAFNHDDGRTLDPRLVFTAPSAGAYVLQVFGFDYPATSDVRFTGNSKCVYRLELSRGPFLSATLPLGVRRGAKTSLQLVRWNTRRGLARAFEFDATALAASATSVLLSVPGFENALTLPVGDGVETLESEPNESAGNATPVEVPGAATGCIGEAGDEDRYRMTVKKDEQFVLEVQSASLGFALDAWLKVEDDHGKELARNDDARGADPRLEWNAPADGTFVAAIGSLVHRGGPDALYRLSISRPVPRLKAKVGADAYTVEAGRTNEVKVTVARQHGFDAKLSVMARVLPEGISADAIEAPTGNGDVTLKLVAATNAPPFSGPFQIVLTESNSKTEHVAVNELIVTGENNGVPNGYSKLVLDAIDQLWLTVVAAPTTPVKVEDKK